MHVQLRAVLPLRTENRELRTKIKKALRRFPGHRARFSYDDLLALFSYESRTYFRHSLLLNL